jgi:adenylate cyclase
MFKCDQRFATMGTDACGRYRVLMLMTLLMFGCHWRLNAQEPEHTDSLYRQLRTVMHDTLRVRKLISLSKALGHEKPDSALATCNMALNLAERKGWHKGIPMAYAGMAEIHHVIGNNDTAFAFYELAAAGFESIQDMTRLAEVQERSAIVCRLTGNSDKARNLFDKALGNYRKAGNDRGAASVLGNFGLLFKELGDYRAALEHMEESMRQYMKIGDMMGVNDQLGNIGIVHRAQGNYVKALEYYFRSLKIAEEQGWQDRISARLSNIGTVYIAQKDHARALSYLERALRIDESLGLRKAMAVKVGNIGIVYSEMNEFDKALEYYSRALAIDTELGILDGMARHTGNIGNVFKKQADSASEPTRRNDLLHMALSQYEKAYSMSMALKNRSYIAADLITIASVHADMNNWNAAEQFLREAQSIAEEDNFVLHKKEVYNKMADLFAAKGEFHKAYNSYRLFVNLRDSIAEANNTREVMELQFQYDQEKRDLLLWAEQRQKETLAAESLKRKNLQRNASLGGLVMMMLLAGVFLVQRNSISREKQRSEQLLLNILPYETAQELKQHGSSEAKLIDHATVLFTDFKGFTAISEQVTPKELVQDLNECFSAFDRICEKYGIEKIKTIGDAYMAAGGLPIVNSTHAVDVTRAAIEMRDLIESGKNRKQAAGLPFFEIRIGIHTGPVVAGIVGVKKFQYDIWGDTVNIASRMESSGEVGRINISEATYMLVKDHFYCQPRGQVQAKGKGLMEMYFIDVEKQTFSG